MIDVSSLTDFQAKIALLIERSGITGRRVSELRCEAGASQSGVCDALKRLTTGGFVVRVDGDRPRYYAASLVHVGGLSVRPDAPSVHVGGLSIRPDAPSVHTFCGESVNSSESINLTYEQLNSTQLNQSKRKNSKKKKSPNPVPGEAGSADEAPTPALASSAPADSFRSAGGAANAAPEAPETPQKIPYSEMVAAQVQAEIAKRQAGQITPERPAAAPDDPDDPNNVRKFRRGLIFTDERHPTQSLYWMLAAMKDQTAADPDSTPQNPQEPIPMVEAFEKQIKKGFDYAVKRGVRFRDFVLHRIAFFLTYNEDFELGDEYTVKEMIEHAIGDNKKSPWNPLLDSLSKKYRYREWGWHGELLSNEDTWDAEVRYAKRHGIKPRKELFPSRHAARRKVKGLVDEHDSRLQPSAPPVACVKPPMESDLQVRIDAAHRSGDPGETVLARIAEKIGEKRFDLWFGREAKVDVAEKELVFSVHNAFAINSIRQHCTAELDETMRELGYVNKNGSLWKRRMKPLESQEPQISREQEIAQAMSSAEAVNAEARERKKSNRPMTIGQLGKKIAQNK